jgi:general secretion pathway protein C
MGSIKLNINYNAIFKATIPFVFIGVSAYSIATLAYIYLPKEKPQTIEKSSDILEYKRYDVKDAFVKKVVKKVTPKKKATPKKKEYQFLSNITLLAIYDMGNNSGFVTVQERGKLTTEVLGIGDEAKGYRLDKVFAKYAIFTKNSKEYRLSLNADNKKLNYEIVEDKKQARKQEAQDSHDGIKKLGDDKIAVKRSHVNSYIKDVDKIWKDINIKENMSGGKIDGFKINNIRKGSDFEKLGLRRNDIIKSVNNIELKSYNDAFKLYNKFSKTKMLNIKILRNNKEVEINYEIE